MYQHANRIKVHLIRSWSVNNVNTNIISIRHLKITVTTRVPRMIIDYLRHQCGSDERILSLSWGHAHHEGTLQRAKVTLIHKVGVTTCL